MKKWLIISCLALYGAAFSACSGDNGAHSGKDTVESRYGSANDTSGAAQSTIDTGKVISKDNSASGGTKAGKDTLTKKDSVKK
jgi:hypothetical protein